MSDQKESQVVPNKSNDQPAAPQRKLPLRKVATIAGWIVFAIVVLAGVRWKLMSPTPVTAVQPQRGEIRAEVFGTGTLESKVVVGVGSKIVGKVVEVLVDQGDNVTAGQTLARLEAKDFEDAVQAAEATLGQAQAELAKAQLDRKRDRDLVQSTAIPQSDLDVTETAYRVGEAHVKNAEAQLSFARARLADTQIISPVAGLVITRNLEVGSTVVPGAPIFRVADTQVLWVQAMVDEHEAGKLRVGQTARITFRIDHGQSFPGRLVRLAREADRVTEEREADVVVDQLPSDWFIGAKANVYIETARKADALQIATSAIVRRGDKSGVFVVNSGRAHWRPVQLGLTGRDTVELTGGVAANDLVITDPFAGKNPIADDQRAVAAGAKERP
jgi:HlyD family secretion protein